MGWGKIQSRVLKVYSKTGSGGKTNMSLPDAVPVHRDDELASEREREDRGPSMIKIEWASPVACKKRSPARTQSVRKRTLPAPQSD